MSKNKQLPFPVDAVYTWVDGNDPHWLEARKTLLSVTNSAPLQEAVCQSRFQDNQELRYSLRSLERYAPWINRVYIVTANQKPTWINEEHAHIVSHEEIFPENVSLPVFSNRPIELCVHRVPKLSEHFIYLNDDFMLGNKVYPQDFFTQEGKARIWATKRSECSLKRMIEKSKTGSSHTQAVVRSHQIIKEKFGKSIPITMRHYPKSMSKSLCEQIWENFPTEIQYTLSSRFRSAEDISITMLFPLFALITGQGILRQTNGFQTLVDTLFRSPAHIGASLGDCNFKTKLKRIRQLKPLSFCLNDAPSASEKERSMLQEFLKQCFPTPSKYELK